MGEYISREAALTVLDWDCASQDALKAIKAIPAADVVEVVRCRECKHSLGYKFPYNYERVLACNDPHGMTIKAVNPMHFCSYGERKEGGQEK